MNRYQCWFYAVAVGTSWHWPMGQFDASANSKTFASVFVHGLRKGWATSSLDLRLLEQILRGA
jgi:hypothetical protein